MVFCVGFATPYWNVSTSDGRTVCANGNQGLWAICASSTTSGALSRQICVSQLKNIFKTGWFVVVQVLQITSLAASSTALLSIFVVNFVISNNNKFTCAAEITAGFAALTGGIGLIVYGREHQMTDWKMTNEKVSCVNNYTENKYKYHNFSWSFFVDLGGLLIILVAAIVLGVHNKPCLLDSTAIYYSAVPQSVTILYPGSATVNIPNKSIISATPHCLTYPAVPAATPGYVTATTPYVIVQDPAQACRGKS